MALNSFRGSHSKPWNMSPNELKVWYKSNIEEGSNNFAIKSNKSMDDLVRFLQHIATINVKEVRKAGSMEKGTFYKEGADIDCIVVLNDIPRLSGHTKTGLYRQRYLRQRVMKIEKSLNEAPFVTSCEKVSNLQLAVTVKQECGGVLEIDILLTADNVNYDLEEINLKRMLAEHYDRILKMKTREQRFIYQPCLTPLQTDFIKMQPPPVKELIRLLKFWKAEVLLNKYPKKLINSYTLELISIYVYEDEKGFFDLGNGFKRVMLLLAHGLDGFKHYWPRYYSREIADKRVNKLRGRREKHQFKKIPVLLDPSDPSDNVFERWLTGLHKVSQVAQETLGTTLMQTVAI